MRIICDAPGQTCNRLWTYVASISECVVKRKHMLILFYDWTIEDFPNLLNCPFIHFPLWHKWYLERGNGWNNYKGLTWKATHSKRMAVLAAADQSFSDQAEFGFGFIAETIGADDFSAIFYGCFHGKILSLKEDGVPELGHIL